MRTGANITYRSVFVFEKGFVSEVLVPEATVAEDATPWAGVGTGGAFAGAGDGAEDFTEVVARFMAARPLAPIERA
jgi:hypothetical protein